MADSLPALTVVDGGIVAKVREAANLIAMAATHAEILEAKNMANGAYDIAKRLGRIKIARDGVAETIHKVQADAVEIITLADCRLADEYDAAQERNEIPRQGAHVSDENMSTADLGLSRKDIHNARALRDAEKYAPGSIRRVLDDALKNEKEPTKTLLKREMLRVFTDATNATKAAKKIAAPIGRYGVIVVDPPWDVKKIERDVRPNQSGLDYPTMKQPELVKFGDTINAAAHDHCHLFLWTTNKQLPNAFDLLQAWGWRYILTMVWHKPGGFQPVGLPQYNCEFVLYARRGSPGFRDTKAFSVCFNAPRGAHSEKPKEFYDMIRRVADGKRLDMFNRRKIAGFHGWGNESDG